MSGSGIAGLGRVWLIGCGNMGGALLQRWMAAGLTEIDVIDPDPRGLPDGIAAHDAPPPGAPDVLVLAVKPQLWQDAAAGLAGRLAPGAMVVSIMAGVGTAALVEAFPDAAVVRAMPNTPARLGQGVTALWTTAGGGTRDSAETLFAPAGSVVWLEHEADFDAVTALSGSGPAYVFAMIEALAAAGEAAGLAPALAAELALATVTGASVLAAEGGATPAELRAAVTSPGGTTAAGLAVLLPGLGELVTATVKAAAARSRELAS